MNWFLPSAIAAAFFLSGNLHAQLNWQFASGNASWPSAKRTAIESAMNEAVALYNAYGYYPKNLTANYNASVPTAQASYSGWIDFGGSISTRVALHEIAHTLGVGQYSTWTTKQSGGKWTGTFALNRVKLFDGAAAVIGCDTQHFWPYGLNFDTEDGTTARIRHIKVVSALRRDMGIVTDSDGDGIPNDWEMFYFGDLSQTATGDADGDGVNNLDEYNADTNPALALFQWTGVSSSDWTTSGNWTTNTGPSSGTFFARLNVNNAANQPLAYDASRGTTLYRPAERGLVIGSGASGNGAMNISGGSFSTVGCSLPDVIGNTGNTGTLTINGGSFSSAELHLGVLGTGTGNFNIQSGTATVSSLVYRFGTGGTGIVNLDGGTLSTAGISRGTDNSGNASTGSAQFRFNGGTLRATAANVDFLEGLTTAHVRAGGAKIDTNGVSISIAQPLLNDAASPSGGLVKSGNGTLTLPVANTFTGETQVTAGTLLISNAGGLGASGSGTTVTSGATLALSNNITTPPAEGISIAGAGEGSRGALQSNSGINTWSGPVSVTASNTRIGVQNGSALTVSGNITEAVAGTSIIFRAGAASGSDVMLSGTANFWTGATSVFSDSATAGLVKLGADNAIPPTLLQVAGSSVAGRLDLNGFDLTVTGLTNSTGASAIGEGVITNNSSTLSVLTVNVPQGVTRQFIGTIQNGIGGIQLVKQGSGTQVLTASGNNPAGGVTILGGTLSISSAFLPDTAPLAIAAGARIALNFTGTDRVSALSLGGIAVPSGVYQSADPLYSSYFSGTGAIIVGNYGAWISSFPGLTDFSAAADPDNDGVCNLLEYTLNGNPILPDPTVLPRAGVNTSDFTFTFVRRAESKSDTSQVFQYGPDFATWTSLPIPATTSGSFTIRTDDPFPGLETVSITLSKSLMPDGKLFSRLVASQP